MEQELGVKLFKRNGRGVTLTEHGEQFYIGAEKALAEAQRTKDSVIVGALESLVQTRRNGF